MGPRAGKLTKQQIFTFIALYVLLFVRFPIGDFSSNFSRLFLNTTVFFPVEYLKLMQDWTRSIWVCFSFVLVGIVLIVNHDVLKNMNIDKWFIGIFCCGGLLYCLYYFSPTGWIAGLISVYLFVMLIKNKYEFDNIESNLLRILIIIVIGSFSYVLFIGSSITTAKIQAAIYSLLSLFPFLVMEEVIFRGFLWAYFKKIGWSEIKIVISQALLFWLFHVYHMFTYPFVFWVVTPIFSLLLGIIVCRYKSITPTTIIHIVVNFLIVLT